MIDHHFMAIRGHMRYQRCFIRVFPEANMSFLDTHRIANMLSHPRYGDIEVVKFDADGAGRYGIWTSQTAKEQYVKDAQREIGNVHFMRPQDFISAPNKAEHNKATLLAQLAEFREVISDPTTQNGTERQSKKSYTGKSAGKKDDLAMAFFIALTHMIRSIYTDVAWCKRCEDRGMAPN